MIQTLSDKLLNILNILKGAGKPFVDVYDYHTIENNGYPYLTFEPIGFTGSISDTCNNNRTYNFQILIFQEITEIGGRQEAKEIITKSISQVINTIDQNYTLDGTVTMLQPISGTITPFVIANGKALVGEITIAIQVIEFIG